MPNDGDFLIGIMVSYVLNRGKHIVFFKMTHRDVFAKRLAVCLKVNQQRGVAVFTQQPGSGKH